MPEGLRERVNVPWLVLAVAMTAFIWGNSLIPGEGSSSISLSVLAAVVDWLDSIGLPSAWVTHHLVRKLGHVTEYALLALIARSAFCAEVGASRRGWGAAATMCLLVASLDETLQLMVPGRCGQVLDVLIDGIGVLIGLGVGALFSWFKRFVLAMEPRHSG